MSLCAGLVAAVFVPAEAASAAEVVPVPCSTPALITAVTAANQAGGADLRLAAHCTYLLATPNNETDGGNGLPVLTANITLLGGPSTRIRRSNAPDVPEFRLIEVANVATVRIDGIFLEGGKLSAAGSRGGGIYNKGSLTLVQATVGDNSAGSGGGIFNLERATIDRTRIDANHAETGGGIDNPGQLAILQSGVENNVARGVGARDGNAGRVQRAANRRALGAGIYNGHSLNIVHSTLARNLAEAANGEAAGGGLYVAEGSTGTALQDNPRQQQQRDRRASPRGRDLRRRRQPGHAGT